MDILQNGKGFTLIELLAVIVILGVILGIAVPSTMRIIENSQQKSLAKVANGIVRAAKYEYPREIIREQDATEIIFNYEDGIESSNVEGENLKYTGKKPKDGIVKISPEGKIAIAIHDGRYCATKSYLESEVTINNITKDECMSSLSESREIVATRIEEKLSDGFFIFNYMAQFSNNLNLTVGKKYEVILKTDQGTIKLENIICELDDIFNQFPTLRYTPGYDGGPEDFHHIYDKGKEFVETTLPVIQHIYETHGPGLFDVYLTALETLQKFSENGESWILEIGELSSIQAPNIEEITIIEH